MEHTECSRADCEKQVHSKGLCQAHYRQMRRRERGLKKPGPKPDPSKPRSRHSEKRKNEGHNRHFMRLGGQCPEGHDLTPDSVWTFTRPDGSTRIICRTCRLRYDNGPKRYRQYGITEERYEQALREQNFACAVCLTEFDDTTTPHIDHDHSCCPGRRACGECFRGLLCLGCNSALGYAKDNPDTLRRLADYISE